MSNFLSRLRPAPVAGGFRMDGYWVWCGSCAKGEDGRYHLFASRWPRSMPMHPGWTFHSEIVRAVADRPEGPFVFQEVVLPRRDPSYFDGRMTHNPTIHRCGDTWLLFYTGVTYADEPPTPERHPDMHDRYYAEVWCNKRIGLATATSITGPWKRPDEPILLPRSGRWDCSITSNPAPCVQPDGSVHLIYKSSRIDGAYGGPFHLGLAHAPHWTAPFRRVQEGPIFDWGSADKHVEDPYLWHDGERFHIIMKDMTGALCGEKHAGIHASSLDCRRWILSDPPKAYSRAVRWDDGVVRTMGSFERPQLLIQDGVPTHLYAATADGPGEFTNASTTWNLVVPLA
jgi:hypothetical protein